MSELSLLFYETIIFMSLVLIHVFFIYQFVISYSNLFCVYLCLPKLISQFIRIVIEV